MTNWRLPIRAFIDLRQDENIGSEIGLRLRWLLRRAVRVRSDVLDMAALTRYEDDDQGFFSEDLTHFFAHLGERHRGGTHGATGADYAIAFSVSSQGL